MALFVLEGLDRTGKSTLAGELARELEVLDGQVSDIAHFGAPKTEHALDEYLEPLLDYRPGGGHHLIYDRAHIGEAVWPAVFDRDPKISPGGYRLLTAEMHRQGAVFVRCVRNISEVKREVDTLSEPLHPEDVEVASAEFDVQFNWLAVQGARVFAFDRSVDDPRGLALLGSNVLATNYSYPGLRQTATDSSALWQLEAGS